MIWVILKAQELMTVDIQDGGGVRGIAALMLLKAVMDEAAPGKKPCEVFDIIAGTSTGGYAIPDKAIAL